MRDLEKAQALLASAPACQMLVRAVLARDACLSHPEWQRLNADWHAAHGPCPGDTPMAGFGWQVREENTLRWCLARLGVTLAAEPAQGHGADGLTFLHALPLGRARLGQDEPKHVIGED